MRLKGLLVLGGMVGFLLVASTSAQALRVCADPDYLPFSNRDGEGFENRIATAVAKALGQEVQYTWASYRGHGGFSEFLSRTLDAGKCDVVMDIPSGSREELTTRPYYTSSYVFVFKKTSRYDLTTMDSPILRQIKIGFEQDTPPENSLKLRGLIHGAIPFDVAGQPGQSPAITLDAVEKGQVDVMITWEPTIGAFLKDYPDLETALVPNGRTPGSYELFTFPMSMGVRQGDVALKKRLDAVIAQDLQKLQSILREEGIKLETPESDAGAF